MDQKSAPPPYDEHAGYAGGGLQPQMQGAPQPYPAGQSLPYFAPLPAQPGPNPAGGYAPPHQQYAYAQPHPQQTVVHVTSDPAMHHQHTTTIIVKQDVNHCLHCCISLFFPPWIFVWIFLCLTN